MYSGRPPLNPPPWRELPVPCRGVRTGASYLLFCTAHSPGHPPSPTNFPCWENRTLLPKCDRKLNKACRAAGWKTERERFIQLCRGRGS